MSATINAAEVNAANVKTYLQGLQHRIVSAIEAEDGGTFKRDAWEKPADSPLAGHGVTCILENGALMERAGVGFSAVSGRALPPSATQKRPELTGAPFTAMGVSLVFHPRNPHIPTVHMNVRMLHVPARDDASGKNAATSWFGGGMDLTPYYLNETYASAFHRVCQDVLAPFGDDKYPQYKAWCDEYFHLKHRNEARGVGGIFFDDVSAADQGFAQIQATGDALLTAYLPIVQACKEMPYGETERAFQAYRRGRYVEFNLVLDRGTHFGLQSGGRTESILMSMPPNASWQYDWQPAAGSPEAHLYTHLLPVRDWV